MVSKELSAGFRLLSSSENPGGATVSDREYLFDDGEALDIGEVASGESALPPDDGEPLELAERRAALGGVDRGDGIGL